MDDNLIERRKAHECACVYATAKNTAAVRNGFEIGGYLKAECEACQQRRHDQQAEDAIERAGLRVKS